MKKSLLFGFFTIFLVTLAFSQSNYPFEQVRKYIKQQNPNKFDSSITVLTNRLGVEVHYLYPLYQAIGWEERFKKLLGEKNYYASFSQSLAFAGDNRSAITQLLRSFDTVSQSVKDQIIDTVNKLKNLQYVSAKEAIIKNAVFSQVIMINESHSKPEHRAFTYSLLEDLYKQGYRYLAMEALNNYSNKCLDSVNVFSGYYICEPIAAELMRKALQVGYKMVSYEDTVYSNDLAKRDSIQASNIYSILKKDPSAKILVHAGYGHISKEKIGDMAMMGLWLKKISGIDPLTIQQTSLTEGSEFEYGKLYYDAFTSLIKFNEPSIFYQNKRPFNPFQEKGYDLILAHPPTLYKNNRPEWLTLQGERKPTLIQPTEKTLFFVQAYYENEYSKDNLTYIVPADQTYITNNEGYYCLFLRKGKYKIVLRDVGYKILATKDLEVLSP